MSIYGFWNKGEILFFSRRNSDAYEFYSSYLKENKGTVFNYYRCKHNLKNSTKKIHAYFYEASLNNMDETIVASKNSKTFNREKSDSIQYGLRSPSTTLWNCSC